jgi:hypothetical protein
VVSTVYPFDTATEFHETLRAGSGPSRHPGLESDSAKVAETVLDLVRSGGLDRRFVFGAVSLRRCSVRGLW